MGLAFYFLWIGQSLASAANVFYIIIMTTLTYQKSGSVTFTAMFPLLQVLSKSVSGFMVSFLPQRWQLSFIVTSSQMLQLLMIVMVLFSLDYANSSGGIAIIFVLVCLIAFFDGIAFPLRSALIPRIVCEQKLVKANSLLSTIDQTFMLMGWSVGGFLVYKFGDEKVLFVTFLLLLLSTLFFSFIKERVPCVEQKQEKQTKWVAAKEGWMAIWRERPIRIVLFMDILEGIGGAVWIGAITLAFVKEVLHQNEQWWGFINAGYFIGTIIGGLLVLACSKWIQQRLVLGMVAGSFSFSLLTLVYSVSSIPVLAILLCVLMGPAYQLRDMSQRTIVQMHVNSAVLPKVLALQSVVGYATFGISVFLMGVVSDLFGVRVSYLVSACLFVVSSMLAFVIWKEGDIDEARTTGHF
jgi:Na+/melibiose symporter-like transporter